MIDTGHTTDTLHRLFTAFTEICGSKYVSRDKEDLYLYGKDETLDLHFDFDILVKPGTTEEIAAIMKQSAEAGVPVTPRGGGSGVTGGALPLRRGIVLSLERLNRILELNIIDGYVIAESGVITADLLAHVSQAGLHFPVPSSAAYSFVGGNVAENAGSITSCRYGTTERYVLNLEVVLPGGEIIWTGANVMKNATGLNLTSLFVGSEGTLGIITKVVYRLLRKPLHEVSLLAGFRDLETAIAAIFAIKQSRLIPTALELICSNALQLTAAYLSECPPLVKEGVQAHLLIMLEYSGKAEWTFIMEEAAGILGQYTTEEVLIAETQAEKRKLWLLRFNIGAALTSGNKKYRDIDIALPLSALYNYIMKVEDISILYGIPVACFGHALDGNLHVMLRLDETTSAPDDIMVQQAVYEIYSYAIANGGVISGEHGIGCLQREFMALQFSPVQLGLMQGIKRLFDPQNILNPDKIF
jgi:glycolate oxidase